MKHVIVGNGIAGVHAAEAIRAIDENAQITMIGDETLLYSRPMISYVLDGSQSHKKLPIRSERFYEDLQIVPLLGNRASRVDVVQRHVAFADGTQVAYDRLLIATGADPRPLKAEGMHLGNIFYLRTENHVKQLVAALDDGFRHALVLGGGLVGFKAAYGLLKRGLSVTMLIGSGYPLSMQVDKTAGRMILDELLEHGLNVEVGVNVSAFEGNGTVRQAVTDAGRRLPCEIVVIGKGVIPARSIIPRRRIDVDLGVLVDGHLQTCEPGVFAAGDVAEMVDIARGVRWVNAIWPEAAAQGRVAGFNMAGRPVVYPGSLSRNVMRVFTLDVLTVGIANPPEKAPFRIVQRGGPSFGYYRRLVFKGDKLVGAVLINRIEQGGVLRSLIENRVPIRLPQEALLAPGFNFIQLLP